MKKVLEGERLVNREKKRVELNVVESCSLDVAESGDRNPAEIARYLGVSTQAVNQIEVKAIKKLSRRLLLLGKERF